jgi:hypothetical protein
MTEMVSCNLTRSGSGGESNVEWSNGEDGRPLFQPGRLLWVCRVAVSVCRVDVVRCAW